MENEKKSAKSEKPEADEQRLHPILTNEEYRAAQAKARKKLEDDRKKAAMRAVEESETHRLRVEEGETGDDTPGGEIVNVTIDLAEHSANLLIDGKPYWHGHTYPVTRRQADSMREMMYRGWDHQREIDGKDLKSFYAAKRTAEIFKVKGGGTTISAHGEA